MLIGDLFSGIGGFSLAARWAGWTTAWYSEIDPYAKTIMAKHFPEAADLGDITQLHNPPKVDVLCGGFPCQDISAIGKGKGIAGARSGLWKEYARIIGEVRPKWAVIENSPLLRTRGLGTVLEDLDALGYDAQWHCIPASAVGAPHQRDRIWIVAYARNQFEYTPGPALADALREGLERHSGNVYREYQSRRQQKEANRPAGAASLLCGEDAASWWLSESGIRRVVDGVSNRVDRVTCLGNAIVPAIPWLIFKAIDSVSEAS